MEKVKFDRYKVNDKLYNYAVSEVPENASPLEEARHIYTRLCKKLCYSIEYFIEDSLYNSPFSPTKKRMSKLSYVETVDGEKNKDVVCFVFTAIYSYILYDRGLITEEDFRENLNIKYDDFYTDHTSIECRIDDVRLEIDASKGLDMDLCLAKFGYHQLQGWKEQFSGNSPEESEKFYKLLEEEKLKIYKKQMKEKIYKNLKTSEKTYNNLAFREKCNLFLASIQEAPSYSLETLSFITETYKNLFSDKRYSNDTKYVDSTFIYEDGELKEYFFVNEKGYRNNVGEENFDALEIYEISLKDKTIKQTTRDELLFKTNSMHAKVISESFFKRNGSPMMNKATSLSPNYITIQGAKNAK